MAKNYNSSENCHNEADKHTSNRNASRNTSNKNAYGKNASDRNVTDKNANNKNAYDKDAKDKNSYNYGNGGQQLLEKRVSGQDVRKCVLLFCRHVCVTNFQKQETGWRTGRFYM